MEKIINKKHNNNEPWLNWLTRELNSFEPFQDFASGKNPKDVAEILSLKIVILFQKSLRILMKKINIH